MLKSEEMMYCPADEAQGEISCSGYTPPPPHTVLRWLVHSGLQACFRNVQNDPEQGWFCLGQSGGEDCAVSVLTGSEASHGSCVDASRGDF